MKDQTITTEADFASVVYHDGGRHVTQVIVTSLEFPFPGELPGQDHEQAAEIMSSQFEPAMVHPGGPREYWRQQMVGRMTSARDGHLMTAAEFDAAWDAAEASAAAEEAPVD